MKPFALRQAALHVGHVLNELAKLPESSVYLVVTSPPYWRLRAYGTVPQDWGGGTWHGELGSELTPELYVEHVVEVFQAVRRVLREDGSCWVNIGDSYANDGKWGGSSGGKHVKELHGASGIGRERRSTGLKPLDLVGIPWLLAFALRADGWYLRADVCWSKPNPLPESVSGWRWERCRVRVAPSRRADEDSKRFTAGGFTTGPHGARNGPDFDSRAEWADCPGCPKCSPNGGLVLRRGAWRPTKAHEYLFLLTKSDTYYADQEAVREAVSVESLARATRGRSEDHKWADGGPGDQTIAKGSPVADPRGRNPRSVWTIPTQAYPGAHFATFPEALVEPCILSGSPPRCCSACGAGWAPVVDVTFENVGNRAGNGPRSLERRHLEGGTAGFAKRRERRSTVSGYRPTCDCGAEPAPALVLDPFAGSGTVGVVALRHGREFVGIELNESYAAQAEERIRGDAPLLNGVSMEVP